MSVVPETTHVVLGTDPNVISLRNVGEGWQHTGMPLGLLGRRPRPEPGGPTNWRAPPGDWVINALAERLALAMISALA